MIKLVAFDWNGTILADTIPCWEGANEELKMAKAKPITLLRWRQTFEIPYIECLVANGANRKFAEKNGKKLSAAFHKYYEARAVNCRTRSGARQVFTWLHKNNILAMIFSNHTQSGIDTQLTRLKIKHYIDVVLAHSEMDGALKSRGKGEKLLGYIKSKKYKPKEVVVVGDTEEEIEIGKKYGFHTVAITGGYNTTSRLLKHKPDFLIHNLTELEKIVKKLNAKG